MDGRAFLESLRPLSRSAQESAILAAVQAGSYIEPEFAQVSAKAGGHQVDLGVMTDTFKIGTTNPVRISASATLSQQIADSLGLLLPTMKIFDLSWQQAAKKLQPALQPYDFTGRHAAGLDKAPYFSPAMDDVGATLKYHDDVEHAAGGASGLVMHGKIWAMSPSNTDSHVVNFGFYHGGSNATPYQTKGTAHSKEHRDYSQVLRLVHPAALLDGQPTTVLALLADPMLAGLISNEGPITSPRIPGVSPVPRGPAGAAAVGVALLAVMAFLGLGAGFLAGMHLLART